jgi:hypothetical protein
MAEDMIDAACSNGPSFLSVLNKLPTKRIDAAITKAREADIPEQGEQTGGYNYVYSHLSHLPLFPLYSDKQHDMLAEKQKRKQRVAENMDRSDPDKLLTGTQKATLSVLGLVSGGGGIVSAKRWERRLVGASVVTTQMHLEQNKLIVFTRWTVPSSSGQNVFVDVLEHRFLNTDSKIAKLGGNGVSLKVGMSKDSKVTLKLLKSEAKGLKGQKTWNKTLNKEPCEAIVFVGTDGKEVAMEMVERVQRASTTTEVMEMIKRFDKEWMVPVLQ